MLAAGLDMFARAGYRATTIESLCATAGVSTRNFYEEFGSREALLIALHDQLVARAFDAVTVALDGLDSADIRPRVRAAVRAYLDVMTSDRRWAQIALVETVAVSTEAEAHRRAGIDRFVALLEGEADALAASGLIERRDYHLTAVALVGAVTGLINTWTANPDWAATVPHIADEATRLIWLAITPDDPAAR